MIQGLRVDGPYQRFGAGDRSNRRGTGRESRASPTGTDSSRICVTVDGASRNLPPNSRDEVYCIAVEAVRNNFAHAQATRVEAKIHYGPCQFRLIVRDNGTGIHPEILKAGGLPDCGSAPPFSTANWRFAAIPVPG